MENELIKMFGENFKEEMLRIIISEFVTDDETKCVFEDLCDIVSTCCLTDEQLVNSLLVLPYNMAYATMAKSNRNLEVLMGIYKVRLYAEFSQDVDNINKKGVSKFEKRYKKETIGNFAKYLNERLLTRYEIELLIKYLTKLGDFKSLDYKNKHEYNGENRFLRHLSSAHAILSESGQSRVRSKIIDKIKIDLMLNVANQIKLAHVEL